MSTILARRLKNLREKHGYLQKFVADKLGIRSNTLSGYENGSRSPDPEMLVNIANLYNVTTDYLLGKSDTPKLTEKDEKDIAKRMDKMKKDLLEGSSNGEGLNFMGEPMSEEAIESLLEALEHAERIATLTNKKFTPKKYRDKE